MLLPALQQARERARTISCVNNIKSFSTANIMYANDNQVLCPVAAGNTFYYGERTGSMGNYTYDLSVNGFLNSYCGKSAKAMACPSFLTQNSIGDSGAELKIIGVIIACALAAVIIGSRERGKMK